MADGGQRARHWILSALLGLTVGLWSAATWAESGNTAQPEMHAQWYSDGLYLSAKVPLVLSDTVENALYKGVPMHFVWRAEVSRARWYWWDKPLAEQVRVVRVAYQPLTRRWRVGVSTPVPGEASSAVTLQQTLDRLDEVLALVGRVGNWRMTDVGIHESSKACKVTLRFSLESGLLAKPFQMGGSEVGMSFELGQDVPPAPQPLLQPSGAD